MAGYIMARMGMWRGMGLWRGIVWQVDGGVAGYGCVAGDGCVVGNGCVAEYSVAMMNVWRDISLGNIPWRGMGV